MDGAVPLQPIGPQVGPRSAGCDHGGVSDTGPTRTDEPPLTDDGPGAAGAPQEDRQRRRLASYTVRNMVWSMLLVTVIVLAWWSLGSNPQESQRRAPEVAQTSAYVVEQAGWPVWVPEPGTGWTPTVVWFDARVAGVQTWHISYTSPAGEYVALHQAAEVTEEWVQQVLTDATPTGEEVPLPGPADGQPWQEWDGPDGGNAETGYLLDPDQTDGTTVVVHGTADVAEIEAFLRATTARE